MQSDIPPPAGTGFGTGAGPGTTAMLERIRRILLEPAAEWPRIAAEPMTVKGIMTGWAVPLAAIGPVAQLIRSLVFGYGGFGIVYRPSPVGAVATAIVDYALALVSVWLLAKIIDALAPTFDGVRDPVAAMKVAAFSMTASWLAGIFKIVPVLSILLILGLYSFYLLYLGLPLLMRAPKEKAIGYIVATVVVAAVLMFIVFGITSALTSWMIVPAMTIGGPGGTVTITG